MKRFGFLAAVLGALACARGGPSPELLAVSGEPDASPPDALALGQALQAARLDAVSLGPLRSAAARPGPAQGPAVEGLLAAQQRLDEQLLVPAFLAAHPDLPAASPERQEQALLLRGLEAQRTGALEEAESLLRRIPAGSSLAPRARYALGVVLSDPRRPGGPRIQAALDELQAVLGYEGGGREGAETRALAQLGIARLLYGLRQDAASSAAYDRVPRDSRVWPESLFERGYPRFRAGDDGGALGTVHATRAPQLQTSFLPEARILEATVLFHACLYPETRSVLDGFTGTYRSLSDRVPGTGRPSRLLGGGGGAGGRSGAARIAWRGAGGIAPGRAAHRRRAAPSPDPGCGAGTARPGGRHERRAGASGPGPHRRRAGDGPGHPRASRGRLGLAEDLLEQADVLRFEMTKGEKELLDADVDQRKLLAARQLPPLPTGGRADERWRVDGEWWSDEIGFERATLKDGCPARKVTPSVH